MSRFSVNVSYVSRRKGSSAVRHAAYRAGERIWDERASRTRDYTGKADVIHAEIVTPQGAPAWTQERSRLWNRVEATERRKDSRLAQEVYVAIPREVLPERRVRAVREFVEETFVSKGMIADFAIHAPVATDGRKDPHVHIMLTTRPIEGDGFGLKSRSWDHPARITEYRLAWEKHANLALARSGSIQRVTAHSLRAQRREAEERLRHAIVRRDRAAARQHAATAAILDRIPEIALGRAASHMEKKGQRTTRGKKLREIRALNARTREARIRIGIRSAMREIGKLERSDRFSRLRANVERGIVHALPAAFQRRVYLRKNRRILARAAGHAMPAPGPTVRTADLATHARDERRPIRERSASRNPIGRESPGREGVESRSTKNSVGTPDARNLLPAIRDGRKDLCREEWGRVGKTSTAASQESDSAPHGASLQSGRKGVERMAALSELLRKELEKGGYPATGRDREGMHDPENPAARKENARAEQGDARMRLQKWLDGHWPAPATPRTAGRERDFGLERD